MTPAAEGAAVGMGIHSWGRAMLVQKMTIPINEPTVLQVTVDENGNVTLRLPGHELGSTRDLWWEITLVPGKKAPDDHEEPETFTGVKSSSGHVGLNGRSGLSGVAPKKDLGGRGGLAAPSPG